MIVDKTHSKKDILKLFKDHGVDLDNTISKSQLVSTIDEYMDDFKYDDKIKNKTELKTYLKTTSLKQRPNSFKKSEIMFKSKRLIKWGKNNYIFDGGTYMNGIKPYEDVMSIYMWGDLPSVRRACNYYNDSPYRKNHVNPIMTDEIREQIDNNRIIKQQVYNSLVITKAPADKPFVINFN